MLGVRKIILNFIYRLRIVAGSKDRLWWNGNYLTWEDALSDTEGYQSDLILEKCKQSLLKVKDKKFPYERDGYLFDKVQYSWPLTAMLCKIALENHGRLSVLDFGGSLGSSYFQNRLFLEAMESVQWNIVEQAKFVECGETFFADENLKFYKTTEDCLQFQKPQLLLLSGVLQYLSNPFTWIEKFTSLQLPYIIIDRTSFTSASNDILTVQKVPKEIYDASYPAWFFNYDKLVKAFTDKNYSVISDFDNGFDSGFRRSITINQNVPVFWRGIIFKRNY